MFFLPLKIRPGDAAAFFGDFVGRAAGDDLAAEAAGGGAEVEEAVGAGDDFAVVLDDEQRVAEVAEFVERGDEAGVVARVEADRGFVEHVEHAAEAAADLAGEADALGFAAGERGGGAAEREIGEADVDQEREPILDFAHQLAGDFLFAWRELPLFDLRDQLAERRAADVVERAVAEADGGGVVAEPAAAALAAVDLADELLQEAAEARREARGFFEGRVEAFELEAEERASKDPRRSRLTAGSS